MRAAEWPTAPGRIEFTQVRSTQFKHWPFRQNPPSFIAELDYSYAAEGQGHQGRYGREFYIEPAAQEFIRDLQGKSVSVSYNPRKLAISTLTNDAVAGLLNLRSQLPEGARPQSFILDPPGWSKPLLRPFIALSLTGLALSLWVHLGALAGRLVAPQSLYFALHIGAIALTIPAMFIAQKRIGNLRRRDFWKVILSGAPDWVRYMVYGFGAYAIVNFLIFMRHAPPNGTSGPPTPEEWRGFSGHWMFFYTFCFSIFYSAAISLRSKAEM